MTIGRSESVTIAILSASAAALVAANILLHASPLHIAFTLIGIGAYAALVRLDDIDPHLVCDTIQSGEAAVGTAALYAVALFLTDSPVLLLALTVTALLLYQLFLSGVLAPVKKEIALSGAAAQVILALIALFVIIGGPGLRIRSAGSVFTGYFNAIRVPAALAAASAALTVIIPLLAFALAPEMRLLSLGTPFSSGRRLMRAGAAAGLVAGRSVLAAVSLLFAGWTCGIGISVQRIHRGALPFPVMVLSLVCLGQAAVLVEVLAGPLAAAAASWVVSYAVFFLYYTRRVHLYDRYQQT